MGTPIQGNSKSDFVYDTGSGTLTTTTDSCLFGCTSEYYDPDASSTANITTNETSILEYGSANLTGMYVRDHVCLRDSQDLCVNNFTFFAIT